MSKNNVAELLLKHIQLHGQEPKAFLEFTQIFYSINSVGYLDIYKGLSLSRTAHKGIIRKNNQPYLVHPMSAAVILLQYTETTPNEVVVALLHDVVEDVPVWNIRLLAWIIIHCNARVALDVRWLTKPKFLPKAIRDFVFRIQIRLASTSAQKVRLAETIHNGLTMKNMKPEQRSRWLYNAKTLHAPIASKLKCLEEELRAVIKYVEQL